jgi:hypothetical protein
MTGQGLAKTNWTSAPSHLDRNYWRYEFAGRAMEALLSNSGGPIQANGMSGWGFTNCSMEHVTALAVGCADALLVELERTAEVEDKGGHR